MFDVRAPTIPDNGVSQHVGVVVDNCACCHTETEDEDQSKVSAPRAVDLGSIRTFPGWWEGGGGGRGGKGEVGGPWVESYQ